MAADESCLHSGELEIAASRYVMINIELDKAGGLTEALRLAGAAKGKGCKLMIGNMEGTSLSMAPAFVVAQLCDFVDIDGPLDVLTVWHWDEQTSIVIFSTYFDTRSLVVANEIDFSILQDSQTGFVNGRDAIGKLQNECARHMTIIDL